MSWGAILLIAAGAYAFKLAGVAGAASLVPARFDRVAALLPAALLPALAAVGTFSDGRALAVDERAAGLAAAILLVWLRAPLIVVIAAAAAVTAVLRAAA